MNIVVKKLEFIGSSKKDLTAMPDTIKLDFGHRLHMVQMGLYPENAKTLSGFGGASVVELKQNDLGGTYRAVYTVQFKDIVYVLHCFKKKSSSGIATPKPDMDLINKRLKIAIEMEKNKRS